MAYETLNANTEQFSMIRKVPQEPSESQSFTNNTFISKFISTCSLSESSSLEISNANNDSIVIKNVFQDYNGLLEVLEENTTIKPTEKDRISLALTTAKGSLVEEVKKVNKISQEIFHTNAFAVPGKFYCKICLKDTMSRIKFMPLEVSFWKTLVRLFQSNKCCGEKFSYPDIVHECPECQAVLARITAI